MSAAEGLGRTPSPHPGGAPPSLAEPERVRRARRACRAPLYLAIRARIYDVSAAWSFYGPGKSYFGLVGRDATRAFCTGCLEEACLISSVHGLTEVQTREADRWVELYEHHDKYQLVGSLRECAAG